MSNWDVFGIEDQIRQFEDKVSEFEFIKRNDLLISHMVLGLRGYLCFDRGCCGHKKAVLSGCGCRPLTPKDLQCLLPGSAREGRISRAMPW